jgi:hypothetical protein
MTHLHRRAGRRSAGFLACVLLLAACVPAQKLQKEQADEARYKTERQERESSDKCTAADMPGTLEHMECRLGVAGGTALAK